MNKKLYIFMLLLLAAPTQVMSQPGCLDRTFGTLGKVSTQVSPSTNYINDMALQADGKIVAVGSGAGMEVVRYTANGVLDTTFNGGHAEATTGDALGVAIQPDGKIVVVGHNNVSANLDLKVARYNPNGMLDATFDGDGMATMAVGTGTDVGYAVAIQPDGKILIAGRSDTPPSFPTSHAVVRFNSNGSLDTTFGNAGIVIPPASATIFPHQLALQSDGKFVIVTSSFTNGFASLVLMRFTTDGFLDSSFGAANSGIVSTRFGQGTEFQALAIQPDGKIVVSCSSFANATSYDFAVLRYNTDGSLDDSFGTGGMTFTPIGPGGTLDQAKALVIQPNGKIILGGRSPNGSNQNFVTVRYLKNGQLDTRWGVGGIMATDMNGSADGIHAMVIQPNGRIVAGGESDVGTPGTRKFSLARFFGELSENSDFDRDLSTDISLFRPSTGDWHILQSSTGTLTGSRWGLATDELASADYDGDLKTDIAVWRAGPTATLYVLNSADNSVRIESFGQTGDDPSVVGDYDGDGQADPAVYRPGATPGQQSYFYYRGSYQNPGGNITYISWGLNGDIAARGDFSGDGRIDPTVFRPSTGTWFTVNVNDGNAISIVNWGLGTDALVPADYTGDGKTDRAVFRNGIWYILRSDTGLADYANWGLATDRLVPADYDGDGRADVAVYRNGVWYIQQSTAGMRVLSFGLPTDIPAPSGYMP